jgi:protein phosphatase
MHPGIKYSFGNHSDVGKKRKINQDSFGTAKNDWGEIFIVADGMGGHKGGEVASKITVDHMCNAFKTASKDTSPAVFLDRSINGANDAVLTKAKEGPDFEGMGTTIVAVIIKDNDAHIAHVGDSRLYLIRNGQAFFKTKDHSFVQDLVEQGLINEAEAETHPKKNRILQAIGTGSIKPDITTKKLYKNDHILLCSDGLSGEVQETEIIDKLNSSDPMVACKELVDLANERGGPDNITVIAINIENGEKALKSSGVPKKKISKLEISMAVLIVLCIGFALYNKYVYEAPPTLDITITRPSIQEHTDDTTSVEKTGEEKNIIEKHEPSTNESKKKDQDDKAAKPIDDLKKDSNQEKDNGKEKIIVPSTEKDTNSKPTQDTK